MADSQEFFVADYESIDLREPTTNLLHRAHGWRASVRQAFHADMR